MSYTCEDMKMLFLSLRTSGCCELIQGEVEKKELQSVEYHSLLRLSNLGCSKLE